MLKVWTLLPKARKFEKMRYFRLSQSKLQHTLNLSHGCLVFSFKLQNNVEILPRISQVATSPPPDTVKQRYNDTIIQLESYERRRSV